MEKIKTILIKNWKWLLLAVTIIIFIDITEDVFEKEIMKIDTIAYTIVVENSRTEWLTKIMGFITNLGGVYILPIISITILIIIKEKKIGIAVFCNLVLISLTNVALKHIVQRPRPEGYRLIKESGYSFPSGHSMVSTAFYGLIIYFIYKYVKNKKLKYILCTMLSLLIVLIAFSRVYLGVHYASDVIAGFLLTIAYLICFIVIAKKLWEPKETEQK